jgi:nucleoside-diphosphate-sugar epimerase
MSKILITGGAGFIGSYLEPELIKRGHDVFITDRLRLKREGYYRGDIFEYMRMREIFKAVQPDVVYHFAGMISRKECEETPQMAIMFNHIGTLNICHLAQEYGARLIYSGSSEEYGTSFSQGMLDEKTPLGISTSMYSLTKRGAGEIVEYYEKFKDLDAVILRYCMLYGAGERHTEYRSAISRFVHYALNNEPLTVHHDTARGWCYITDAIEATATVLDKSTIASGEIFNIGNDEIIPTECLANLIIKMCNSKSKINIIDPEPTIIPYKSMSYNKIFKAIGWKSKTSIEDGLKLVIASQKRYLS